MKAMDLDEARTSMRSVQRSGKSALAMRDIDSATCALMALSLGVESCIIAGTKALLSVALSTSATGASSYKDSAGRSQPR